MSWDDTSYLKRLNIELDSFNWQKADQICEEVIARIKTEAEPIDENLAKRILSSLRRKKRFAAMSHLAEEMIRSGLTALQIRRQYAQALIDQGMLMPAEMVLQAILLDASQNQTEIEEARGLLGRVYKQLYVNNNDPNSQTNRANLVRSVTEYLTAYQLNPSKNWWHGINVVALVNRANRDGWSGPGWPEPNELAKGILLTLKLQEDNSVEPLKYWEIATRLEAYIALNDRDKAARVADIYVSDTGADAFEINSTLRQLEEVWQLTETAAPGDFVLPILRTAHMQRTGSCTKGDPKALKAEAQALDANMKGLEAIFGPDKMQTYLWYKKGLETCESVARIERKNGKGHGTGWVVDAADFFPNKTGKLLLTNNHVISQSPNPKAIFPDECQINFQALGEVLEVEDEVEWYSSYLDLDATFLRFKIEPKAKPLALYKHPLQMAEPAPRLYIIGHPRGRDLELSLQDNHLLALNNTYVHYRTPTEPGNSGSPVFEPGNWEVTALHHKGSGETNRLDGTGTYEANEGISILALQQAKKN